MVAETLTHEGNELHMGTQLLEVETPNMKLGRTAASSLTDYLRAGW